MKTGLPLSLVTQKFMGDLFNSIDWKNIWRRPLSNGAAFEWTCFAALIYAASRNGYNVEIPLIDEYERGDYFLLRNQLPQSHGALAGNSAQELSDIPLSDRFFFSLIPKAIIRNQDHAFSIFREGCPYHKIMQGQNYQERTDIIFIPGAPSLGYPLINEHSRDIYFSYEYTDTIVTGIIRPINSPLIPCIKRIPYGGMPITPQGIVECSVNKPYSIAENQIERYNNLFFNGESTNKFTLLTGNDLSQLPYLHNKIDLSLNEKEIDTLVKQFYDAAVSILSYFSITV